MATAQELFGDLVTEHLARPQVSVGRMLVSEGLKVHGKVYAFLNAERLVVKLPAERAAALVADGSAEVFTSGGRKLKEWVAFGALDEQLWRDLMDEASAYVERLVFLRDNSPDNGRGGA